MRFTKNFYIKNNEGIFNKVSSGRVGLNYKEYYEQNKEKRKQRGLRAPTTQLYLSIIIIKRILMKIKKIIGACAPLRRDRSRLRSLTSGRQINNFI